MRPREQPPSVDNASRHGARLRHVREVFETLGRDDPLYGVLTSEKYRGNRWDPAAFFRRGEEEIERVFEYIDARGYLIGRQRALDFGCGVGRLTQALATRFAEVVGIDISSTMIDAARSHDRHGSRVRYVVNTVADLGILTDDTFDFIYSSLTLQHIPPELAERYIREFVRVLNPGGLAIFQLRNGPRIRPGTFRSWLYELNRHHVRRLLQRLRGRAQYEMHYLARERVEELVAEAGGSVLDVVDMNPVGRPGKSLRFTVTK